MNKKINNTKKGFALITTVVIFMIITTTLMAGVSIPTGAQVKSSRDFIKSKQSYIAADSVNEDALYRLNQAWTLPTSMSLPFSSGILASALVTDISTGKQITTTGTFGETTRLSKSSLSQGTGVSFQYGLQVGTGGLYMSGSSRIRGSVYSSGDIYASSSASITGSATAANTTNPTSDQTNSLNGTPTDLTFGNVSGSQDVAMKFIPSVTGQITNVRLYIKKVSTPNNITLRITSDNSGSPSATSLGSGTLSASLVTTSYGYVTIPLSTPANVTSGTNYWIVVDVDTTQATKYYSVGAHDNSYISGVAKKGTYGSTWSAASPSTLDIIFDTYIGGNTGIISGDTQYNRFDVGTSGIGDAWAHEIRFADIAGTVYCQANQHTYASNGSTVKNCDTSRADPVQLSFPVSNANIDEWKEAALAGGVYNGDISIGGSTTSTTPAKKIVGNLTVSNSGILNISGPIWVTGNVNVTGSGILRLDSSYGANDGYIIADGRITVSGSGKFNGSGTTGSYIVAITTSTCPTGSCGGAYAVDLGGSAGSVVLVAPDGSVKVTGSAKAKSVVGKSMLMTGSAEIEYETGLADMNFTDGPSGSWVVDSWQEVTQ